MSRLQKYDLKLLHMSIERQKLRPSKMLIDQNMADDIFGVQCEHCGGWASRARPHTHEDCELHRVSEIMES